MVTIKYKIRCMANMGTNEAPDLKESFTEKEIRCPKSKLQSAEDIAKKEAWNGEYTVEDDGRPDPVKTTAEDVLNALLGVSEQ